MLANETVPCMQATDDESIIISMRDIYHSNINFWDRL